MWCLKSSDGVSGGQLAVVVHKAVVGARTGSVQRSHIRGHKHRNCSIREQASVDNSRCGFVG